MHGIILTDNTFLAKNQGIGRGTGAHRIATHLRKHGFRIEVIDFILRWNLEQFQTLCKKITNKHTLFLAIGTNLFDDDTSLNDKLKWYKSQYPQVKIILGGNNLMTRDIQHVDHRVEGYAEKSMLKLLEYLSGSCSIDSVKWHPKWPMGTIIDSAKDYPLTAEDTQDLRIEYLNSDFIKKNESLGLETARGCIFNCKFCTYPLIGKKKIDYIRDMKTIKQELINNHEQHGISNYIISEDTFNDTQQKLTAMAEVACALPFKLSLVAYLRFDLIMSYPDSYKLLKACGLRGAFFGIETFNREAGKLVGKGGDPIKIKENLLRWAENMPEVQTQCGHIAGLPLDDEETQWQTLEWYKKNKIQKWNWNPLYIVNTEKNIHASEFSKNFKKYKLEIMSENEVNTEINNHEQFSHMKSWSFYINSTHINKIIFWKNQDNSMNYFKATRLANNLNLASKTRLIGPWLMFMYSGLGYCFDDMQKWGYFDVDPHVPEIDIEHKTKQFVNGYIKQKLGYKYILPTNP